MIVVQIQQLILSILQEKECQEGQG